MFTIWCWAIRPLPSVNGIVKTVGRVPAASAAVNVGAVQLYSSGWTVIQGYLSSNSLICRFSASTASWVAPGRRTPTVIATASCDAAGAADAVPALAAGWLAAALGDGLAELLQAPATRPTTAIAVSDRLPSRPGLLLDITMSPLSRLVSIICGPIPYRV